MKLHLVAKAKYVEGKSEIGKSVADFQKSIAPSKKQRQSTLLIITSRSFLFIVFLLCCTVYA